MAQQELDPLSRALVGRDRRWRDETLSYAAECGRTMGACALAPLCREVAGSVLAASEGWDGETLAYALDCPVCEWFRKGGAGA